MALENIFCETCGGRLEFINDSTGEARCVICKNNYRVKDTGAPGGNDDSPLFVTDGKGTIMAYNGTETSVVIPYRIGGELINAVGEGAFRKKGIKTVAMAENIRVLGEFAFTGNNLSSISLGGNVEFAKSSFDAAAFYDLYSAGGKKAGTYIYFEGRWVNSLDADRLKATMQFFQLCKNNKLEDAQKLWNDSANIDLGFMMIGNTALIQTTYNGHTDMVKWLIKIGSPLDAKSNDGKTALMRAVYKEHKEIVKALLDAGADVNIPNKSGKTFINTIDEKLKSSNLIPAYREKLEAIRGRLQ